MWAGQVHPASRDNATNDKPLLEQTVVEEEETGQEVTSEGPEALTLQTTTTPPGGDGHDSSLRLSFAVAEEGAGHYCVAEASEVRRSGAAGGGSGGGGATWDSNPGADSEEDGCRDSPRKARHRKGRDRSNTWSHTALTFKTGQIMDLYGWCVVGVFCFVLFFRFKGWLG